MKTKEQGSWNVYPTSTGGYDLEIETEGCWTPPQCVQLAGLEEHIPQQAAIKLRERIAAYPEPPDVIYGGEDKDIPAVMGWSVEFSSVEKQTK